MKIKITIIGLGNIGKRHLQAVSSLKDLEKVLCYDIKEEALVGILPFIEENHIGKMPLETTDNFKETLEGIDKETIVIVATTAQGRERILKEIIGRKPLAIICEKPLCQNKAEYKNIVQIAKKNRVSIYINFSRHMYDFYQGMFKALKGSSEIFLEAFFSGGMACNGIHILELATWLLDPKEFKILHSKKDTIYETKRQGYQDFSGEIALSFDRKNSCLLKALDEGSISSISITHSNNKKIHIDEAAKKVRTANGAGIRNEDIEIPFTSQITDKIILNILQKKHVQLPTIQESQMAHDILFDYMEKNNLADINFT